MMSDILTDGQGIMNANDAISMMQIADGTLKNVGAMTNRLTELSVASNNAALSSEQKNALSSEFNATVRAIDDSVSGAKYNGKEILGNELSFSLGSSEVTARLGEVNTSSLDISSQESIEKFANSLEDIRSEVGATTNGLKSSVNTLMTSMTQKSAARSGMQDTDIAKAVDSFTSQDIKLQAAMMAQVHQNNFSAQRALSLLQ
jgi:flagellin